MTAPAEQRRSGLATAALVLGVVSVGLCLIPILNYFGAVGALVGLVLGAVALRRPPRAMAVWGVALSVAGIVLSAVVMDAFVEEVDRRIEQDTERWDRCSEQLATWDPASGPAPTC